MPPAPNSPPPRLNAANHFGAFAVPVVVDRPGHNLNPHFLIFFIEFGQGGRDGRQGVNLKAGKGFYRDSFIGRKG